MKILVVTPLHPVNIFNGASQRISAFIKMLQKSGLDTHVLYTCQDIVINEINTTSNISSNISAILGENTVLPSLVKIRNTGRLNELDDYFPGDILDGFQRAISIISPDCVLVNYVFLSKLFEYIPDSTYKVIDTHDKLSRAHIYKSANLDLGFFCTTEEEELRGLARADTVVCIQNNEAEYFSSAGIRNVITVGHKINKRYIDRPTFRLPKTVGFLGSNHVFNSQSIINFLSHQRFTHTRSLFDFVFAGAICDNDCVKESDVIRLGRVKDELDFYNKVDIVLNPVVLGTGLKIKTIEALSFGIPVLGTKVAFDGINTDCHYHTAPDIDAIYDSLESLHADPGSVVKLANLSKYLFEKYQQSVSHGYEALIDIILSNCNKTGNRKVSLTKSRPLHIHHIVNPLEPKNDSDLYFAQPVTFHSFDVATQHVNSLFSDSIRVNHHMTLVDGEECCYHPLKEYSSHNIHRTIRDFPGYEGSRPLPLLSDILSCISKIPDSDYVVFSNIDISLMPTFYEFIYNKINDGYDALVINRRTISKIYSSPDEYSLMTSDYGKTHPGYDCFVFSVSVFRNFILSDTIVGVHLIGRVLLWNILKFSKNPLILRDSHLTFHIGDDNAGKDEYNNILVLHNYKSALNVLSSIYDDAFNKKISNLVPDSLRLFYKPNIYRDLIREKKYPIFVHSMFRTGSSYLWAKLDEQRNVTCYYEPLHESLASLSNDKIKDAGVNTSRYHKRLKSNSYWANYKGLINTNGKGIKNYNKKLAYYDYTNTIDNDGTLKTYISTLIDHAEDNRPIFQFNRTALRQKWFRSNYPDALNFYLVREPRSQFNSFYKSYIETNGSGFIRTDFALIDQNINSSEFDQICRFIKMPNRCFDEDVAMHDFFKYYDKSIANYNIRQLYFLFLWHWTRGLVNALNAGSMLINMTRLSDNLIYRRTIEYHFIKSYLYLDLDDCNLPSDALDSLSDNEYEVIESNVFSLNAEGLSKHTPILETHFINTITNTRSEKLVLSEPDFKSFLNDIDTATPSTRFKALRYVPMNSIVIHDGSAKLTKVNDKYDICIDGTISLSIPLPTNDDTHNKDTTYIIYLNVHTSKANDALFSKFLVNDKSVNVCLNKPYPVYVFKPGDGTKHINLLITPADNNCSWQIQSLSLLRR